MGCLKCGGAGVPLCHTGNQVSIACIDLCERLQPHPWAPAASLRNSLVRQAWMVSEYQEYAGMACLCLVVKHSLLVQARSGTELFVRKITLSLEVHQALPPSTWSSSNRKNGLPSIDPMEQAP